ncbi:MAG: 23S rRNA (uracil(1939)-C(5))-methyltransferase RlmD [Candidatus Izemoplasmatales bacterium]|jgi:23S rRNA (uracil1939-C5)-methyltransferase
MFALTVGSKIRLEIRKQGINGEGIGYFNKLAIFVPGTILKEVVLCEIVELKERYAIARIDEIERISTKRIEPPCKFYDRCGGCQMQHIKYEEQLKIKQSVLRQALARYTDLNLNETEIRRTIGMKDSYHYRNKSQMPFKQTNFGLALGFFRPNTNHFVYVDDCIVQDEMVNRINSETLSILRKHQLSAVDGDPENGILYNLVVRHFASTKSASVTFIIKRYDPKLELVAKDLMKRNSVIKSVTYSVNKKRNPMVFGSSVELIAGDTHIIDKFGDYEVRLSPDVFHQLNSSLMQILYDEIIKAADLQGGETVIDCYSGIGLTSMLFAAKAKEVIGIDYAKSSIADATANIEANQIENVRFIAKHVESVLPELLSGGEKIDLILLDPPRMGLDDRVINALLKNKAKKVIYVSCNPSTLAKNLKHLLKGYTIEYIQPLDMFPHTASVESITLLKAR